MTGRDAGAPTDGGSTGAYVASASLVVGPLGEVKYLGQGHDGERPTWDYACERCGQTWHLPDILPRTRGHRCPPATGDEVAQ